MVRYVLDFPEVWSKELKITYFLGHMWHYEERTVAYIDTTYPQTVGHTQTLTWQREADEFPRM